VVREADGRDDREDEMQFKRGFAALVVAGMALCSQPAIAEDITLEFTVWNYSLDTIQDNARQFEEANPGIKVNITDYTWQDYHDSLVLRFRGGTPTDVAYVGQDWLPAWAAAGFFAPLDDIAPADVLADLKKDIAGFSLSDMTYNGKLYGLPYYADTISFIYNKKLLADKRIAVPQTWEEVMAAAEKLKAEGMEHPIVYELIRSFRTSSMLLSARSMAAAATSLTRTGRRSSTTLTTPPTSSLSGWRTPSRRTWCSRRHTNRRSSRQ
jgi:ABC-type glycerol-3-phosphate transport system substrate-binding protein